jgi:undecaprenyl-diphosphatase
MPAIYLSAFYEMRLIGENSQFGWESTILATAMAFMVGYITIAFLLRFLIRHTFGVFAAYRVILGLGVLAGIYFFDVSYLN